MIGGVLQILIQIPSLARTGWRLRWFWDLAHPGVRRVAGLIGPRLFGIGIVQIDVLVGTQFASHMIEGSVASIGLADRVMELVLGGYAIALSTAILPLLARQAAAVRDLSRPTRSCWKPSPRRRAVRSSRRRSRCSRRTSGRRRKGCRCGRTCWRRLRSSSWATWRCGGSTSTC